MRHWRGVLGAALLALALGVQPGAPPTTAEAGAPAAQGPQLPPPLNPPLTVRVGLLASVSDSGVYIGLERGYYRELGLELNVETVPDPNTIITLTSTNRLDVGGSGVTANPFQAAVRGIPVKTVAE